MHSLKSKTQQTKNETMTTKLFHNARIYTPVDKGYPKGGADQNHTAFYENGALLVKDGLQLFEDIPIANWLDVSKLADHKTQVLCSLLQRHTPLFGCACIPEDSAIRLLAIAGQQLGVEAF